MKNIVKVFIFLVILLSFFLLKNPEAKTDMDNPEVSGLMKKVSVLQIPFIENQGQIKDKSVRFYAKTFGGTVFVTEKGEIVYSLIKTEERPQTTDHRQKDLKLQPLNFNTKAVVIKESLECPEGTEIKGINKSITKVNYFIGAKENWKTNIPTWQEVSLSEIYKGIELKLKAYGKNVEKVFTIYPGAKVEDIKLKIEGAKELRVNKDGELEIETRLGIIKMTKPVAYQEKEGKREIIEVTYTLTSAFTYAFKIGEYDNTKPLVIDPLLASTFIGGSGYDEAHALAIDSLGNVFVAGRTSSSDYPTTSGAYDTTYNGGEEVFVSKLDGNLGSFLASTFIGGSGWDYAYALVIDSSGNVFVTGDTSSSDYPTTAGAYDTTHNGYYDIFVSKLDNDLSADCSVSGIGMNTPASPKWRASMAVDVYTSPSGTVKYYYTRQRVSLESTSITSVSVVGNTATITGTGNAKKYTGGSWSYCTGCSFTATIVDGSPDKMDMEIDGGVFYSAPGGLKDLDRGDFSIVCQ